MPKKFLQAFQLAKKKLIDKGSGLIEVDGGLVLTDESVMHSGTSYDVDSLDISEYRGTLFADHGDGYGTYNLDKVIGHLVNVRKEGKKVIADGIQYALANPLGSLVYSMTRDGFLDGFSIGTFGAPPNENNKFVDHSIYEVSQVALPNNKNSHISQLAINSLIAEAEGLQLNTSELKTALGVEELNKENKKMFKHVKNGRKFAVKVKYTNSAGEEVETTLEPGAGVDVAEDQVAGLEAQIADAPEPTTDVEAVVNSAVAAAVNSIKAELEETKKQLFNQSAKAPEFMNAGKKTDISTDWRERHVQQVEAFRAGDTATLRQVNQANLDALKEEKLVTNSITIEDMGNFVVSPEMVREIQGSRNDYSVVDRLTWRETLSTQTQWLRRSGDINMTSVAFCDDGEDGNRKPISEYGASLETANMEELAAVTPVCNAATRFLAVDLLGDINAGYRTDYDRKRLQLFVARLQQAVTATGNSIVYHTLTSQAALESFIRTFGEVSAVSPTGVYVMSYASVMELQIQLVRAGLDAFANLFFIGQDGITRINGKDVFVVPNDILPALGTNETRSFTVNGSNVTISHAVFYLNLGNFSGRISGGLQYDLSTQAAYEVVDPTTGAATVRSAWQRNEIVLRGSFFRNGFVSDPEGVAGLIANPVS